MTDIAFETLLSFIFTCAVIEITPGPNMAYLAVLSASNGRWAGFSAVAGVALGLFIIGIAAALGIATLIANSEIAYQILRWGGVLYLLWLAWDGWHNDEDVPPPQTHEDWLNIKYFTRGLVTNLLNPKAAMFYVAILPSFITAQGPLLAQTTFLTCVYVVVATLIHGAIVGLAGAARPFLEDPRRRRTARRFLSTVLALIALWFAVSTGQR